MNEPDEGRHDDEWKSSIGLATNDPDGRRDGGEVKSSCCERRMNLMKAGMMMR